MNQNIECSNGYYIIQDEAGICSLYSSNHNLEFQCDTMDEMKINLKNREITIW